jgi:alpha-galactosidase
MCAGGGGRFDAATIAHSHTNWMSDQVSPVKNLAIHFGSQLAHCAVACNDWLICWPPEHHYGYLASFPGPGDLAFRTRVAMLGSFGVSAAVEEWSPADVAVVATHADVYRRCVRPLIHHGNQYRLTEQPPFDGQGDWAAMWYAAKNGLAGALFAFRLAQGEPRRSFALPGLIPDMLYAVEMVGGGTAKIRGTDLANGLAVTCPAPFTSQLVLIHQELDE